MPGWDRVREAGPQLGCWLGRELGCAQEKGRLGWAGLALG
jgi:hypothetical protein